MARDKLSGTMEWKLLGIESSSRKQISDSFLEVSESWLELAGVTRAEKRTKKTIDKLKTVAGRALIK